MTISLINPYPPTRQYALKGNLHTHTTVSDGTFGMQEIADQYAARGYGFLMFSDHDKCGDISALNGRGMVLIPGVEVSGGGPHLLQVGTTTAIAPDSDRQKVIDNIKAAGGFAVANHPNWEGHFNHFPQGQLERLKGYEGLEIYNACIRRLEGSPLATDRWDMLLTAGRIVWGHGTDDMHHPEELAKAWDVAFVNEVRAAAVLQALRTGAFYASTGVTIESIRVVSDTVYVSAPDAEKMIVVSDGGRIKAEAWGSEITYRVKPVDETYVRIECYGRGDLMAWTQPFFVAG